MTGEPIEVNQVIIVPRSDPLYSAFVWRTDSITLARLRPVLDQLRYVPDQPCRLYTDPHTCITLVQPSGMWCIPCQIRSIKATLFTNQEQP